MRRRHRQTVESIAPRGSVQPARRHGSISVELLLIAPVFVVLLLAFVELSTIVIVEERLAVASAQGARVLSQGGTTSDVQTAVNNSLGAGPIQSNLNPIIYNPSPDPTVAVSGAPVTVRLEISAPTVVPDLLSFIGYSICNQILVGQTVMRKE